MKYYILLLFSFFVLTSTVQAQERNLRPLRISTKLAVMPFPPGVSGEIYYHINNRSAIGFEAITFATEPRKHKPVSGWEVGPDFPYTDYIQSTSAYMLKYQLIPEPRNQSYFQFALSGGIGVSYFGEIVDYVKKSSGSSGMGFFGSSSSYHKITEDHTSLTGMIGFNTYKRKRTVGLLFGVDVFFTEHQVLPLIKTGMQFNFFKGRKTYHGGAY